MNIPLNFNPLGFTLAQPAGELPAGYTRLAFLVATTGYNYIATGYSLQSGDEIHMTGVGVQGYGYPQSFCRQPGFEVNSGQQIQHNEVNGGIWYGSSTNIVYYGINYGDLLDIVSTQSGDTVNGRYYSRSNVFIPNADYTLDLFANSQWATGGALLYTLSIVNAGDHVRDFIFCISPEGTQGAYDRITRQFLPGNENIFICGLETLDQLTALASNLPTVTGSPEIKLSLPGEWNGDASANEQLSIITGKGWSTTITYRDVETSTSSSFVLGNRGDGGSALVLWCKAVESDSGNYQDADGVRYYVETCHDIWHPQELSPDDLGYTAVLTLEDYLTERGLTAVVYEEEELHNKLILS